MYLFVSIGSSGQEPMNSGSKKYQPVPAPRNNMSIVDGMFKLQVNHYIILICMSEVIILT